MPDSSVHIGQLLCQAPAASACTTALRCPRLALPLRCTAALPRLSHAMCLQGPHMTMKQQIGNFSKVIYCGGELRVDVCMGRVHGSSACAMAEAAVGQAA